MQKEAVTDAKQPPGFQKDLRDRTKAVALRVEAKEVFLKFEPFSAAIGRMKDLRIAKTWKKRIGLRK
jgi:hypothetical protein